MDSIAVVVMETSMVEMTEYYSDDYKVGVKVLRTAYYEVAAMAGQWDDLMVGRKDS